MASHAAGSSAVNFSDTTPPISSGGARTSSEAAVAETVSLNTRDGKSTEVTKLLLKKLGIARQRLLDDPNTVFEFPEEQLRKVIFYCEEHMEFARRAAGEEEIRDFDRDFMRKHSTEDLVRLLRCVFCLDMEDLMDLVRDALDKRVGNKSVDYVRKLFLQNDFTQDEMSILGIDSDD